MKDMIYKVLLAAIGVILFAAGITDIRNRQVGRGLLLVLALSCIAALPFQEEFRIYDALGGLAVGLCAVGVSMASRGQIGKGDGIVIAAVGVVLGFRDCLAAVCVASLLMCTAAIAVLLCRKGNRNTRLPFLPAVFAGYALYAVPHFL